MRVQRTRTKQLRAPLTTTLVHQKSAQAISKIQIMFVQLLINWIIIINLLIIICDPVQQKGILSARFYYEIMNNDNEQNSV